MLGRFAVRDRRRRKKRKRTREKHCTTYRSGSEYHVVDAKGSANCCSHVDTHTEAEHDPGCHERTYGQCNSTMILLGRDEIPRTRIHIGQDWQLWVRHGDDSYTTFSAGLAVLLQLQLQLQCSHGGWRMDDVRAARLFFSSGSLGLSHSSTGKSRLLECSLFEVTCCLVRKLHR